MKSLLMVAIFLSCSTSAMAASHPDCKGMYVGKKYYINLKNGGKGFYTIKGIDKEDNLLTMAITEEGKSVEASEEFSCTNIKEGLKKGLLNN